MIENAEHTSKNISSNDLSNFVCKPVAKKDYLQKFYDNYLTEKKTAKRNKWYHQHQSTKLVNIIFDNEQKKKEEEEEMEKRETERW